MHLHKFPSLEEFISASARFIAARCPHKTDTYSTISTIGLSGGSTPGSIYSAIAQDNGVDFSKVEFYQVDERYVPADHSDSNQKMITETLVSHIDSELRAFHFFDTSLPIDQCLAKYEQALQSPLMLTVLGIGPDGHTASLFPRSQALNESTKLTAHTTTDQFAIHDRLTLTFPAIMASQALLVLLKGKDKQSILDTILNSNAPITDCPAKKLLEHPNLHLYFGDF